MLFAYLLTALLIELPDSNSLIESKSLAKGLDLITIHQNASASKCDITILRIDPKYYDLVCAGINLNPHDTLKSAKDWCRSKNFIAAINAGMFATDYISHTGYLKYNGVIYSKRQTKYQSVLAFKPNGQSHPLPFRIYDLDEQGVNIEFLSGAYSSVIQNLRLIKRPGVNVWGQSYRVWSEAAIGEDNQGRILFIYSNNPVSMHDLNDELLRSNIGIVAAQHLEGGPLAQLYIHIGTLELSLGGGTDNQMQGSAENPMPVPNVIGIKAK